MHPRPYTRTRLRQMVEGDTKRQTATASVMQHKLRQAAGAPARGHACRLPQREQRHALSTPRAVPPLRGDLRTRAVCPTRR